MEVQVDFLGADVTLKLVLIWFLFFHVGFRSGSKIVHTKGKVYLYTHFLNNIHFL